MTQEWHKVLSRGMHPILMMDTIIRGLNERLKDVVGFDFNHQYYKRYDGGTYFDKEEWEELKNLFRKKAEKNQEFYFDMVKKRIGMDKKLLEFSDKIAETDIKNLSLAELKQIFVDFMEQDLPRVGSVYIPFNLEELFEDIIKSELRKKVPEDKVDEYFAILTTCPKETYSNREKIKLLELAVDVKKRNLIDNFSENKEILNKIKKHSDDFIWLNQYFYSGEPYTTDKIILRLKKLFENDVEEECKKIKSKGGENEKRFNQVIEELKLSDSAVKLSKASQEHSFARDNLIGSSAKIYFNFNPFFRELAKRINLDYEDFINLRINDIIYFIDKKIELNDIKKGYGILLDKGNIKIYTGKEIEKLKVEKENIEGIKEVKGIIANRGYVQGRVKILKDAYSKSIVEYGDIIIAPMTTPNLALSMEKAAAFVTNEGGLTCHAAIIAREMDKPCIIGTKIATQVFKDGDFVEVDANKGIVRKLYGGE